jgi:predicted dinucleotide-binding enzyme
MANVTIFGDGNMGSAIADVLTAGGATVNHITTADKGEGTVSGDIVILAVPYPALESIVSAYGDQLAGKTVVDITNPLNFETFDSLTVPADSSAAAELAAALPSSKVLKAFNTTFAATLAAKAVGPNRTTVLIAGDDADAKAALAAAVTAGRVEAVDAGPLSRARELEALGFLELSLANGEKISWTGGFGLVR